MEGAVEGYAKPFAMVEPMATGIQNSPGSAAAMGEGGEIQICSIRLQVVLGDITHETTDSIVNGTNQRLNMSSGKNFLFQKYKKIM